MPKPRLDHECVWRNVWHNKSDKRLHQQCYVCKRRKSVPWEPPIRQNADAECEHVWIDVRGGDQKCAICGRHQVISWGSA